jgi:hypothetical protein
MKYMEKIHPTALFRLSVLGQLISRDKLERGELRAIICKLAAQTYQIPGGNRVKLSERTIENWYYTWRHDGIEGLAPKVRTDK